MLPAKITPRFVPTLTEIVHPAAVSTMPVTDHEKLLEQVVQRVIPLVQAQLREVLELSLQAHADAIAAQYQDDLVAMVKSAVAQAMAQDLPNKD